MAAHHSGGGASASESPKALLLRGEAVSPEDEKLTALLEMLGVPWRTVPANEIASYGHWEATGNGERPFVLSSASCIATVLDGAGTTSTELPDWMTKAGSVYVYGFGEDRHSERALRFLTGDPCAQVRRVTLQQSLATVTGDFPEMCGPMSGLQFEARTPKTQSVFELCPRGDSFQSVVSFSEGPLLVSMKRGGAHLFLNS